jgi:hypothetical protein
MIGLDAISVEISGATLEGDCDGYRLWRTQSGDPLALHFFAVRPDLTAGPDELEILRAGYRAMVSAAGVGLISCEPVVIDGCAAIETFVKVPQTPHGMTYVGAVTLPFRDFSIVLKVECVEFGMTGIREAVVLPMLEKEGRVELPSLVGWCSDPYDSTIRTGILRNLSEDETYDEMFPEHPLSRARSIVSQFKGGMKVSDEIRAAKPFAKRRKRWFWPFGAPS